VGGLGLRLSGSGCDSMGSTFEDANEASNPIEGKVFLDCLVDH
jgi:hypothetical protein